jgi:hypothetical protein
VRPFLLAVLLVFLCPELLLAQSESRQSQNPKICVATVANASTVSAFLERLTERLVKSLNRGKLKGVAMDSVTTMDRKLRPTRQNAAEADDKHCDYTLLTQIVESRAHPAAAQTQPRNGAMVPSVDAADPLGGTSGPVYRENMQVSFALFRASHYDAVIDTYVLERASANVVDTLLTAMDRIANRVSHDLEKK